MTSPATRSFSCSYSSWFTGRLAVLALAAFAVLASSRDASAQGCILIRDSSPMMGSSSSAYLPPGQWQLDVSYRDSTADRHYSLDVEQVQRHTLGTYVINKQKQVVVNLSRGLTPRLSVAVAVPFISASWSIPSPISPVPGARAEQHGSGVGDISVTGRMWLLDPATHGVRNLSLGLGLKTPSGNSAQTDTFLDITGANLAAKAVDQSVQPGDGGWGTQLEAQGFSQVSRVFVFGSANYLLNPRNMNDTPSILVGIGRPSTTAPLRNVNSVPDQYILRAGVGVPIGGGFGAAVAWRMEGVPRYDLIGRSDGFRRPGNERYFEPSISYSRGRSNFQLNVPIGYYRYRAPDPYTGANGDATFPNAVAVGSYSFRFGTPKHQAMPGDAAHDPSAIPQP